MLGEIFVSDGVGHEVSENVDKTKDGLVSINDILINGLRMNTMVVRKRSL